MVCCERKKCHKQNTTTSRDLLWKLHSKPPCTAKQSTATSFFTTVVMVPCLVVRCRARKHAWYSTLGRASPQKVRKRLSFPAAHHNKLTGPRLPNGFVYKGDSSCQEFLSDTGRFNETGNNQVTKHLTLGTANRPPPCSKLSPSCHFSWLSWPFSRPLEAVPAVLWLGNGQLQRLSLASRALVAGAPPAGSVLSSTSLPFGRRLQTTSRVSGVVGSATHSYLIEGSDQTRMKAVDQSLLNRSALDLHCGELRLCTMLQPHPLHRSTGCCCPQLAHLHKKRSHDDTPPECMYVCLNIIYD